MRFKNAFTLLAFAIVLAGCITPPNGFREGLAAAEVTHTSVVQAVDSSLNAGTISSADAQSYAAKADKAQLGLVAAKNAYEAGNTGEAHNDLTTAVAALTELQNLLRAQGALK